MDVLFHVLVVCPSHQLKSLVVISHAKDSIATVLRGDFDGGWMCHFGLKCASWTSINMGTSGRSVCTSIGNFLLPSVAEGNKLASRKLGHFLFMQHVWVTNWEVVYTNCDFNLASSTPPLKRYSLGRFHAWF